MTPHQRLRRPATELEARILLVLTDDRWWDVRSVAKAMAHDNLAAVKYRLKRMQKTGTILGDQIFMRNHGWTNVFRLVSK